jgi:hypothetical protein
MLVKTVQIVLAYIVVASFRCLKSKANIENYCFSIKFPHNILEQQYISIKGLQSRIFVSSRNWYINKREESEEKFDVFKRWIPPLHPQEIDPCQNVCWHHYV